MQKQRNPRIDILRGALILSVIVGHIVIGSIHTQPIRYAIYAVHMPLFIVLTGFLVNTQWLQGASVKTISARYWGRVVKPFIPAFAFFTGVLMLHALQEHRLTMSWVVESLVSPYYHLWFIPTLLIWVAALAVLLRVQTRFSLVLVMVLLICAATSYFWAAFQVVDLPKPFSVLLSKKVVYFFGFFVLGVLLRRMLQRLTQGSPSRVGNLLFNTMPAVVIIVLCTVAAALYAAHIGYVKSPERALAWLVLNVGLAILCIRWFNNYTPNVPKAKATVWWLGGLEAMGRLSLPIYLWHVLPLFLLKGFEVHIQTPLPYYVLSIASSIAITALIIGLEHRSPMLNRWVYGMPDRKVY